MKICIASDLHVDTNRGSSKIIWPHADVCVVAGDISNDLDTTVATLTNLGKQYGDVVFVGGNHEHYNNMKQGIKINDTMGMLYKALQRTQIHFLTGDANCSEVLVDGVRFVGATGWYTFSGHGKDSLQTKEYWREVMNDYRCNDSSDELVVRGIRESSVVRGLLSTKTFPTVVVTHMVPTMDAILQRPHDTVWQHLNGCFYSEPMGELLKTPELMDNVKAWIFGHTHFAYNNTINGVNLYCNPRGYPEENPTWKPIVIEV